MNISDIKDIATIATPFVVPLVNTLISPRLKELSEWLKKKNTEQKVSESFWNSRFEEYLLRAFQKFLNINVLVFPNQQINIKDIFCPLTIVSWRDHQAFKIGNFTEAMIKPYQKILISDTAGMGKSTLLKWIGLSIIENQLSIPILIELRKLNKNNTILNEVFHQIDPIEKSFDKDLILQFLKLGCFTILLDGFDEIESDEREFVINDIKDFVNKANSNWFILTSRPDSSLPSFGDFQMFRIRPLEEKESFNLIKKYDALNPNKISKNLIEDIKEKFQQVQEFLINPFLVSLLYKSYTYNKDIPSKKSTFYDEVYCALYKHHDLTKDGFKRNKKSGLDIHDFRLVLQNLAFNTAKEIKVEYTEGELISRIKNTTKYYPGINYKPTSFMEDLELTVPLFVREGKSIKWAHKSIQDYFAAEFISSHSDKEKIINLLYRSEKENYLNILDFLYEMENNLFRKIIIKDILDRFNKYYDENYPKYHGYGKKQVKVRLAIMFLLDFVIFYSKKDILFDEAWKTVHTKYPDFLYKTASKTYSDNQKYGIFRFRNFDFAFYIMNIIGKKNENLFIKQDTRLQKVGNYNFLGSEPEILDCEHNSILNLKENFEWTNIIILKDFVNSGHFENLYLLDYDKCKKLLIQLEQEVQNEKPEDIFSGI